MISVTLKKTFYLAFICFFAVGLAYGQWELRLSVPHRSQQEDWSCGPNTIAMWAGYVGRRSINTYSIADQYTGRDGTSIPEFLNAMDGLTDSPYAFNEWAYSNKYAAIKGVMYSVARYNEPVAFAGNLGQHYYLIVGGGANRNPYTNYGMQSSIQYLYIHDSRQYSPLYDRGQNNIYPILRKGQQYSPDQVMGNWQKIPLIFDRKWRSVERGNRGTQGNTYNNTTVFFSY
jgi:hypothetical protein